jgi:hypothetical protein
MGWSLKLRWKTRVRMMRRTAPAGKIGCSRSSRCSNARASVLIERFYSGQRDGQVTFRDGVGGAKTRLLERRLLLLNKRRVDRLTQPSDGSGRAQIALTLLVDALGDEGRGRNTQIFQPPRGRAFSAALDDNAQPRSRLC